MCVTSELIVHILDFNCVLSHSANGVGGLTVTSKVVQHQVQEQHPPRQLQGTVQSEVNYVMTLYKTIRTDNSASNFDKIVHSIHTLIILWQLLI